MLKMNLMMIMMLMLILTSTQAWQIENYYDEEVPPPVPGQFFTTLRTKYVSSHAFHTIEGGSTPKWMRDVINALGEFE